MVNQSEHEDSPVNPESLTDLGPRDEQDINPTPHLWVKAIPADRDFLQSHDRHGLSRARAGRADDGSGRERPD